LIAFAQNGSKFWDQKNLDQHGHDHQEHSSKLKDQLTVVCREMTHFNVFKETVIVDVMWLFQTPSQQKADGIAALFHVSIDQQLGDHHRKCTCQCNWRHGNWGQQLVTIVDDNLVS